MTTWRDVDWSQTMGGNDEEGDCGPVALGNLMNLWIAPQIVGRTEVERFYTVTTGWTAETPGSDRGSVLEEIIRDWCARGWPADPTMKPDGYEPIALDRASITAGMARFDALVASVALPEDQDFSDQAVDDNAPGVTRHAVLLVDASQDGVRMVTWAAVRLVSWRWWRAYGRQAFGVPKPWAIALPDSPPTS